MSEARRLADQGRKVGAMLLSADIPDLALAIRMPPDARRYAQRLYATLHELDDAACDVVLVECVPNEEPWLAIADRLERAAAPA
jgi:L-threonylcarbamoyladenylate synthase